MMQAVLNFPALDPELFSFAIGGFEFALRWYALAYMAGLLLGWWLVVRLVKRADLWPGETAPMTAEQVGDLLTWVILGVVLGGRLGFVIFYKPMDYLANPIDIVKIWEGGMAFHGGLIGVVVALILYCRSQSIPLMQAADALALATPPGLFFGRIANFINAELWGRPSDVPWAMVFPGELAALCPPGWEGPCARHPSQLYEAALEGLILGLILLYLVYRRGWLKVPGLTAGLFFAGYGVGRFIVEFFRQADFQFITPENPIGFAIHWNGIGVTMGQLLSLPMVAFGAALILIALRQKKRAA
ncbi:diacylglyceryl transferase [Actibacterium mucosum KCTC 23349]|uniref:Phosphatidylglycerol--prolipoprotein diacylglyceryl transferase n=2 Tax=Actibacterium TaxID=1433986 RepID=A0A037ZFA6_9RHOB|nr:diacylglyceryl transferase [Actibacterium mucosum KCTC 23349]